ncbi:hypothetical protein BGX30_005776 [Mortierella sp. GBA39]|nr:hypothetical protein BGX30_005776 [Mortierella sp. GBA39]
MAKMDKQEQVPDEQVHQHWSKVDMIMSYSALYNTAMNACNGANISQYRITGVPRNDALFVNGAKDRLQTIFPELNTENDNIVFFMPTFRKSVMTPASERIWDLIDSYIEERRDLILDRRRIQQQEHKQLQHQVKNTIQGMIERNQLAQANEAIEQYLQSNSPDQDIFAMNGMLHLLNGDPREAILSFKKGYQHFPWDEDLVYNLGYRAKALGDHLTVALSTDDFNRIKGKAAYFSYEKRKMMLEAIKYVDEVIPETCWEQKADDIQRLGISVFVMGNDWSGKFDELRSQWNNRVTGDADISSSYAFSPNRPIMSAYTAKPLFICFIEGQPSPYHLIHQLSPSIGKLCKFFIADIIQSINDAAGQKLQFVD